jgi:FAD/FMN-containing dehydrogenase/ferredoxin
MYRLPENDVWDLRGILMNANSEPFSPTVDPWKMQFGTNALFPSMNEGKMSELARTIESQKIPDLRVISAEGWRALYSRDQADVPDLLRNVLFQTMPGVVVQPFSIDAVAKVLRFATSKRLPIVIRGSGSSPFGGSMPVKGGIVLDMNAMDRVLDFDSAKGLVKVQAGMRWSDLDWFLEKYGMTVRSSPSSRFSTVGGWVATGGIGIGSVSGGHLSSWVSELEVVTSGGEIRILHPSDKRFNSIFGSEGRLAVIVSVTLQVRPKPKTPFPALVFFDDREKALKYASFLAQAKTLPLDLTYYSPGKFEAMNRILGRSHFPSKHGVMWCYESKDAVPACTATPSGAKRADTYLASLIWNERFFPMKFRKLGPGLMGSEVMVPQEHLAEVVSKADKVSRQHGLSPLMEVHFMPGGDGLLLTYYTTDQAKMMRYTMDSFRGLLISSVLIEAGAKPYSLGVWNNMFSDQVDEGDLASAKAELDPTGIMNRGKYPRLKGRLGGLPAAMFTPGVMGSVLRLVNRVAPVSAPAIKMVSGAKAFDRAGDDMLLRVADECSMCGACVGVCPAYLLTKDERVTARGKLLAARQFMLDGDISKEHAHRIFLCMRCKACEQVCQSKLHLIDVYDEMEKRLEKKHGKDDDAIKNFVALAEQSPAYDALVDRGLVLGAAAKAVQGGK